MQDKGESRNLHEAVYEAYLQPVVQTMSYKQVLWVGTSEV